MKSHLFILCFMSLALGDISVKILLCEISEIFPPVFSYGSFMVLPHIYIFYPSWDLFVCVWHKLLIKFHLHVAVQISQHRLLKRLFLHHFMILPPLSNIKWPQIHGFIFGLPFLFHWSMCFFLCQYQTILITVPF